MEYIIISRIYRIRENLIYFTLSIKSNSCARKASKVGFRANKAYNNYTIIIAKSIAEE